MATFSIKIKRTAQEEILALPRVDRERVVEAIDGLANEPLRGSALKGELRGLRRLRVGQMRVIYEVQQEAIVVLVLRIGHRKDIYR